MAHDRKPQHIWASGGTALPNLRSGLLLRVLGVFQSPVSPPPGAVGMQEGALCRPESKQVRKR